MDEPETSPRPRLFTLQPSAGTPIYRQLIDQVRRMVTSGALQPGAELPSVRDVAVEYTVNPTTISKAYGLLEAEGLLQRHRGKPMTVAGGPHVHTGVEQRLRQIEAQVDALVLAARQLQLCDTDLAALIKQKWGNGHD